MDETKDPSYPWYPRDFEADEPVKLMTLAQEGAYRRLLDHQWLNGSVPGEVEQLARICKNTPVPEMRKMWAVIERCFIRMDGLPIRLQNRRLERERRKRKEHREKQTASGRAGAKARWEKGHGEPNAIALPAPMPVDGFALALPLALPEKISTTSARRSADEVTDGQIMAAIRDHLYQPDGKPPAGWEESREFSIMRQLRKHGKSGTQIRCVVEGLGVLAKEGSVQWLKGKTTLRAVFNSNTGCLDMWGQAEDAYYRAAPEGGRKKTSATDIGDILATISPRTA